MTVNMALATVRKYRRGVSPVVGHILIFGLMITSLSLVYTQLFPTLEYFEDQSATASAEFVLRDMHDVISDLSAQADGSTSSLFIPKTDGRYDLREQSEITFEVGANNTTSFSYSPQEFIFQYAGQFTDAQGDTFLIGDRSHITNTSNVTTNQKALRYSDDILGSSESLEIATLYERDLNSRVQLGLRYRVSLTSRISLDDPAVHLHFKLIEFENGVNAKNLSSFPTYLFKDTQFKISKTSTVQQFTIPSTGSLTIQATQDSVTLDQLQIVADDILFLDGEDYITYITVSRIKLEITNLVP